MSIAAIAGLCGGLFLLFLFLMACTAGVILITSVVGRSKRKGVKFVDGVNKDEWALVQDAISETMKDQQVLDALKSINAIVTKAISARSKVQG